MKKLIPTSTRYKFTHIAKDQVNEIRLLKTLQRKYKRKKRRRDSQSEDKATRHEYEERNK